MRTPLPGCEPLPSRDASLRPTSVSPARVAWHGTVQLAQHGLAWLLMARHGMAQPCCSSHSGHAPHWTPLHSRILVPIGTSGTKPLFYTS